MSKNLILVKSFKFAVSVINAVRELKRMGVERELLSQLL